MMTPRKKLEKQLDICDDALANIHQAMESLERVQLVYYASQLNAIRTALEELTDTLVTRSNNLVNELDELDRVEAEPTSEGIEEGTK